MTFIDLDRRFIPWTREDRGDPEFVRFVGEIGNSMSWTDLRARRRVVILAEAGSGKSTELQEQARLVEAAGSVSFYITVQNIGKNGVDRALGRSGYNKLQTWLSSKQPAWFFLDSVDEAKKADVRLSDVLKEFADTISDAEARVHLVLSGRHSDWEFSRDLEALKKFVPIPPPDAPLAGIDPNKTLISILRGETPKEEEQPRLEEPVVVIMGALDQKKVELFARQKGVSNSSAFLRALDESDLWDFARRPLDLDWLVSFWRKNGALGSLSQMINLSLRERLKENNPERARIDNVDEERALAALNRIGAALVLQRLDTIEIPDSSLRLGESVSALALDKILPDWSGTDRSELSLRPVFDPASAGHMRLHNDNQGTVRSYLAARWLQRLRSSNCPWSSLSNLLFATTYGQRIVKPSMRATAAWLALWDSAVAKEIIARDPQLLLSAGDPSSLPLETRRTTLEAVIKSIGEESSLEIIDRDALKRFASPDIAPFVREQWKAHAAAPSVRQLLLRIIWLGKLDACASIATEASFDAYSDYDTRIFSGRALMATASREERRRYVRYLTSNSAALPAALAWDAIEELFPTDLTIADLLALLQVIDLENTGAGLGLVYYGPKLVEQLSTAAEITELLSGIMGQLEARTRLLDDGEQPRDELYLETIEAAGRRLLELSPGHEAPILAIDAALRIGESRRRRNGSRGRDEPNIFELLQQSPIRRRASLWRAAQTIRTAQRAGARPIIHPWQLEILGFYVGFRREDTNWLLEDVAKSSVEEDQSLAANSLMIIWRQENKDPALLDLIRAATANIPIAKQAVSEWLAPSPPPPEAQEITQRLEQDEREDEVEAAEYDRSWIEFAESLRTNPGQLRTLTPPSDAGVDSRLYRLWHLLRNIGDNKSHYAIRDLSPLRSLIGESAVDALRDAFITYWRYWIPKLKCERPEAERNFVSSLDIIGIVGVTQEALSDSAWAERLSPDEAALATVYATLELNGFPDWLDDLAKQHPATVADTLLRYAESDLTSTMGEQRHNALENLSRASDVIVKLIAARMFNLIRSADNRPLAFLDPALRILQRGYRNSKDLLELALSRFAATSGLQHRASYFALAYAQDPEYAATALMTSLRDLDEGSQTALVQTILPRISDSDYSYEKLNMPPVPFDSLERLVQLAFSRIHPAKDKNHSNGKVYSPDDRDHAESARDALFRSFINTPGLATYDAISRMIDNPLLPISKERLRAAAAHRVGIDSETAPWTSDDVREFESDFRTAPSTPADLQRVAISRLEDLQHRLIHGDFNQGLTVARLEAEVEVQNWFAEALYDDQGRSYSLEREPHVAEEKEPDIRLQAKVSNARCPIEIKVAESWSVPDLEKALTVQLRGRYLRDRENRWGILLLVHKTTRPRGWQYESGWLTFEELVKHLRALAWRLAAEEPLAPQMAVCTIDVSKVRR